MVNTFVENGNNQKRLGVAWFVDYPNNFKATNKTLAF